MKKLSLILIVLLIMLTLAGAAHASSISVSAAYDGAYLSWTASGYQSLYTVYVDGSELVNCSAASHSYKINLDTTVSHTVFIVDMLGNTASCIVPAMAGPTAEPTAEPTWTPTAEPTAKPTSTSASCGANLTWAFDSEGTLTISGTGGMYNYSSDLSAPWDAHSASIVSVIIEDGVTSIGDYAFADCTSLTEITIPDSVASIDSTAFADCTSLTSIDLPDGITAISNYTFSGCTSLTSIDIPDSVNSIGISAFEDCSALEKITFLSQTMPTIGSGAFDGVTPIIVCYEDSEVEAWAAAQGYAVEYIGLSTLILPASLTVIEAEAFEGLNVERIVIPASVSTIGSRAFADCAKLTRAVFEGSSVIIESDAFDGCSSVTFICDDSSDAAAFADACGFPHVSE